MLNTVWSQDTIRVKEEMKEEVHSNTEESSFHSSLGNPPSSPAYSLTDYHKLSPPDSSQHYFYSLSDPDNNQLQTFLPLPSFSQSLPDSPSERVDLTFTSVPISEMTSSPDSSVTFSNASNNIDSTEDIQKKRKRSNSGSSGSSATSGSCGTGHSRPKVRRRQPLSQDELNKQRNEGKIIIYICIFIKSSYCSQCSWKTENSESQWCIYKVARDCAYKTFRQTIKTGNIEVGAHVHWFSQHRKYLPSFQTIT